MVRKVLFFRPSLGDGGADRVTLTVLQHLDRARFAPTLVLVHKDGVLVDDVPADVPVLDLGAARLATAIPALAAQIRAREPDIVVCTAGAANVVAVAAHKLARSRARLVLSERSALQRADRTPLRNALELRLKRLAYARADVITAVSDGVAEELRKRLGLPGDKIRVVYNPMVADDLPAKAAQPVPHPWFSEDVPVLLAVGRLVAIKDYPVMLEAFAAIRRDRRVRLAILGEGPLREQLVARALAFGIADDVAFLGYDKNPYRYMRHAALLLQSSRAEGLPGALIQSLACGTPVITTDCDHGPREVVRDGIDGYLVPVGDARALAARAQTLLGDAGLRARMSAAAIEGVRRYTVERSLHRYEAAFEGARA
jgi:glycosyltransferase involved in cell wall biosynthesis